MTLELNKANTATIEHIEPRSKGGKNEFNLVAACSQCNTAKGSKDLIEWLTEINHG